MCPCENDELKTTGNRLSVHKSDGAVCPFRTRHYARSRDRDALVSLNMVPAVHALCELGGRTRP